MTLFCVSLSLIALTERLKFGYDSSEPVVDDDDDVVDDDNDDFVAGMMTIVGDERLTFSEIVILFVSQEGPANPL